MSYNRVTSLVICTGLPLLGAAEATPGASVYQQQINKRPVPWLWLPE